MRSIADAVCCCYITVSSEPKASVLGRLAAQHAVIIMLRVTLYHSRSPRRHALKHGYCAWLTGPALHICISDLSLLSCCALQFTKVPGLRRGSCTLLTGAETYLAAFAFVTYN